VRLATLGLDELSDDALQLLHLIYSLITVAMAVEVMHQSVPTDAADAVMIRTDEPCSPSPKSASSSAPKSPGWTRLTWAPTTRWVKPSWMRWTSAPAG